MIYASLAIAFFVSLSSAESTHTFVEIVTGTSSFVPVNAFINNDNHLVYSTVEGATFTSTYVDQKGYLTTSYAGGQAAETTANNNYVSEEYTLTTTLLNTQHVDFGQYFTTTTYDSNGDSHIAHVEQNSNLIQTITSWDNDGHPNTYYVSASQNGNSYRFSTIQASTVSNQIMDSQSTISSLSLSKYTATSSNDQKHRNGAVSGPIAGVAGIAAGAVAALLLY